MDAAIRLRSQSLHICCCHERPAHCRGEFYALFLSDVATSIIKFIETNLNFFIVTYFKIYIYMYCIIPLSGLGRPGFDVLWRTTKGRRTEGGQRSSEEKALSGRVSPREPLPAWNLLSGSAHPTGERGVNGFWGNHTLKRYTHSWKMLGETQTVTKQNVKLLIPRALAPFVLILRIVITKWLSNHFGKCLSHCQLCVWKSKCSCRIERFVTRQRPKRAGWAGTQRCAASWMQEEFQGQLHTTPSDRHICWS